MIVNLVPLSLADAESISDRVYDWWMEMYSKEIPTGEEGLRSIFDREETPDHIRAHISGGTVYSDIVVEGKVVGLAAYRPGPEVFYIDKLYLDASARGMGIGGACLEEMLSIARSRGCTKALLHVSPGNKAAYRFYLERGFVLDHIEDITDCFGVTSERHHLVRLL